MTQHVATANLTILPLPLMKHSPECRNRGRNFATLQSYGIAFRDVLLCVIVYRQFIRDMAHCDDYFNYIVVVRWFTNW